VHVGDDRLGAARRSERRGPVQALCRFDGGSAQSGEARPEDHQARRR
jgi:hypothetical protein